MVALDTEYIDPELMHADSPNIPPPDCQPPVPTGTLISNPHATLTHVQSMPTVMSERQGIPISRPAADDLPVRTCFEFICTHKSSVDSWKDFCGVINICGYHNVETQFTKTAHFLLSMHYLCILGYTKNSWCRYKYIHVHWDRCSYCYIIVSSFMNT